MQEIWKDIVGYEGLYQISNFGNVRRKYKDKYKTVKGKKGLYLTVSLCKDCVKKSFSIHRLVALHFLPNPRSCKEVNHIDGNKHNNNIENLEWVTQEENLEHARKVLGNYPFGKKARPVHKLDVETNLIIETYESISEASRNFNCLSARTAITNCCKGRVKSAYGYKWQYADN